MKYSCFLKMLFIIILMFWSNIINCLNYNFKNDRDLQLYQDITKELRCVVCQNQTLYDSNSSLANDLKFLIYKKIDNGDKKSDIIVFMATRYGDSILYKPPLNHRTVFLWLSPVILLLIGSYLLVKKLNFKGHN